MPDALRFVGLIDWATPRRETLNGRPHIVAPVTMLVEGVHKGSFYPLDEIERSTDSWADVPVTLLHPYDADGNEISIQTPGFLEKQGIGVVKAPRFEDNKLKAEAWIDEALAEALRPGLVAALASGKPEELSTGLFLRPVRMSGVWNGEPYTESVHDYRGDHLAILPGLRGACSVADGCRFNSERPERKESGMLDKLRLKALVAAGEALGFKINEFSFSDIRCALQKAVGALDKPGWSHYVRTVYPDWFVYEAWNTNPSEAGGTKTVEIMYKAGYTVDTDGQATIVGAPTRVREETQYVPVSNGAEQPVGLSAGEAQDQEKEKKDMEKKELIQTLIACPCNRLTANDEPWLEKMDEKQLEAMRAADGTLPPGAKPPETPKPSEQAPPVVVTNIGPVAVDDKKLIGVTPEQYEALQSYVREQDEKKAAVIKALSEHPSNRFKPEYLKTLSLDVLLGMKDLAAIPVSYAGNDGGPVRHNADDELPEVTPMWDLSKPPEQR